MNIRRKWRFNPIGEKYGMLTVIAEAEKILLPSGQKPRRFICECECGKKTNVLLLHLVRQRIRSCGCLSKVLNGESKHPICRSFKSMHERCAPGYFQRHSYFEKGITVCDEWSDYLTFKKWATENGFKKGLQIDRIDNSKGYAPDNCRFVTNIVNVNNRDNTFRVIYHGEEMPIMEVFRKKNIDEVHHGAIRGRIKRGWDIDSAIDTPTRTGNYVSRYNIKKKPDF